MAWAEQRNSSSFEELKKVGKWAIPTIVGAAAKHVDDDVYARLREVTMEEALDTHNCVVREQIACFDGYSALHNIPNLAINKSQVASRQRDK